MSASTFILIGAKGGSGSTTLSIEIARSIRRRQPVTIVDADFSGRRSIAVLLDAVRTFDAARTEGNVSVANVAGGITAVEMAPSIQAAFTIKVEDIEDLASTLAGTDGTAIVVDAPQPFAAAVRPFVVRATKFLLVCEPTVLGVTGAKAMLNELTKFGIPGSRVGLIANHRDVRPELPRSDIESALGAPLVAEIPLRSDKRHPRSVDALAESLLLMPDAQPLGPLQPSSKVPIGDRRNGNRRPYGQPADPSAPPTPNNNRPKVVPFSRAERDERDSLKAEIHAALATRMDLLAASRAGTDAQKMGELRNEVSGIVGGLLHDRPNAGSAEEIARLREEILDEALGFGPIEDLMRDPEVTEIMVNGHERIFVERAGKIEMTRKRFSDDRQLRLVIERMIAPIGRRIDESQPMVDGRLQDGSRINAVIEPLALDGPTLTIRRFGTRRMQIEDLIRLGAICDPMVDFLRAAVEARLNVVISGGTGSGKTTFLNILSSFLPNDERIVTIEDAAELYLAQDHVVRLEARPANIEGRGEIRIRDLVKNALRMRPDRIIVGECRGGEALDMLQAMNTGHDGSLTTVHANSARDAISRIETMVMMAGFDLPIRAIREQIQGALDIIIQTARMRDGSRKIISISEVVGMEGDVVTMQEIVRYKPRGLDKESHVMGDFVFSGVQPNCLKRFDEYGISYDIRNLAKLSELAEAW